MKRVNRLSPALACVLALGACGNGFSGEFVDETGLTRYEFTGDGRVYMSVMGVETAGEYEVDGDRIVLRGPHGSMVFSRDGDDLAGPMGLRLVRQPPGPR